MSKNIREYLDYYSTLESPKYSVLINGKWGSGKTWFIQNYLKEIDERSSANEKKWLGFKKKKNKKRSFYVTLNGVENERQIELQFLYQLFPKLDKKWAKLTTNLIGGLLDTKFDIRSISSELNLSDYLVRDGLLIVFDDLERSEITLKEILGYINRFVEHEELNVIILTDETKIENQRKFEEYKEKIVGRTFTIKPNFNEAYNSFINEIVDQSIRYVFEKFKPQVSEIFRLSNSNNLRLIRYGTIEFSRILKSLELHLPEGLDNDLFLEDLFKLYFSLSIEIGLGNLQMDAISNFKYSHYSILNQQDQNKEQPPEIKFDKKYENLGLNRPVISYKFWIEFFKHGLLDIEELMSVKSNPKYFQQNKPLWYKLWDFYELSDDEYEELLNELESKFKKNDFNSAGEIIHICGTLIELNSIGLYHQNPKEIIRNSCEQILNLSNQNQLGVDLELRHGNFRIRDILMGCQLKSLGNKLFRKFLRLVEELVQQEHKKYQENLARGLLSSLKEDTEIFVERILLPHEESVYPLIKYLDLEEFMGVFKSKSPKEKRDVIFALKKRIRPAAIEKEEAKWIHNFSMRLKNEYEFQNDSIEKYSIEKAALFLEKKIKRTKIHLRP